MVDRDIAHVLVVDDEPHLRELLADALAGLDVQVTVASTGQEAISLARRCRPDLLVTDLRLGDCTGLDVIDDVRTRQPHVPAVLITGHGDPHALSEASRRRPVELMTKPLDIERLRSTVRLELAHLKNHQRQRRRERQLRLLARKANQKKKSMDRELQKTSAELTSTYRKLTSQLAMQETAMTYQRQMLQCRNDDDVFRAFFQLFVQSTGSLNGVALACDSNAELQIVGRFGVPSPDSIPFCKHLIAPIIDMALAEPRCAMLDAGEKAELFDASIRKYLCGLSILAVPLLPEEGQLIGLVVLYRKGEQPFVDEDMAMAEAIAMPTSLTIRRNE